MKIINERPKPDRISTLPEHIIHQILSHLLPVDNKQVIQTSSLSKTWHHFYSSFPYLDFTSSPFKRGSPNHIDYIDKTLNIFHHYNLNLKLQCLTIPIIVCDDLDITRMKKNLDKWIELVIQRGVVEFNLEIKISPLIKSMIFYNLPSCVFSKNSSTKVAKFDGVSLLQSFPNRHVTSLNNLLNLHLHNVGLDEETLSCIITSCPAIEELTLSACIGIKHVRISNLNRIKALSIYREDGIETVEIYAPSLEILELRGPLKIRVVECPKLTELVLHAVILEEIRLNDILSRLSSLTSLSLISLYSSPNVKISNDTLTKFVFRGWRDLVHLDINAPNLLSVDYHGSLSPLACSSHLMGRWAAVSFYDGVDNPANTFESYLVEMRKLISKVRNFDFLALYIENIKHFSFKKLTKIDIDQPVGIINHLDITIVVRDNINYSNLFDGLLWSCHPYVFSLKLHHRSTQIRRKCLANDLCKMIKQQYSRETETKTRSWIQHLEDTMYVKNDGTEYPLPIDGSLNLYLPSYYGIKFIFKW